MRTPRFAVLHVAIVSTLAMHCTLPHPAVESGDGSIDAMIDGMLHPDALDTMLPDRRDAPPTDSMDRIPTDAPDAPDARDSGDGGDITTCSMTMCGTACVDTRTDVNNCGSCGHVCTPQAHQSASCVAGACSFTCVAGFADCDGNAANGCEVSLATASNCGACSTTCSGATPVCSNQMGTYACASGCMSPSPDRCGSTCTSLQTDVENCGSCANACPSGANSTPTCAGGACGLTCATGFQNCDANAANGCESAMQSDPANCGACGVACLAANNASPACISGSCGLTCATGFGNCDSNNANGCETTLGSDVANCGACSVACPSAPNAMPTCTAGACGIACATGFGDCNGNSADGCEANFATSTAHCGGCGTACSTAPNVIATCNGGACVSACAMGFADCNGNPADGCEANLSTDSANCGACGAGCTAGPNQTATCVGGTCSSTCSSGYGDCDHTLADGCETPLSSDVLNCGACGTACVAPANGSVACIASNCVVTCLPGFTMGPSGCTPSSSTIVPPRLIAPLASSIADSQKPAFKWALGPSTTGVQLQFCRDRAMTMSCATTATITGTSFTPGTAMSAGVVFWRAFGVAGSTGTTPSATWEVTIPVANPPQHQSWGSEPDFDGDGLSDVLIGEPGAPAVAVYYGSSMGIATTPDRTLTSSTPEFGVFVASAGDVNGDGFADALIGARQSGVVYVYFGSATGLSATASETIYGPAGPPFGRSASTASDVNGDGYADVIVGSCWNTIGCSNAAYLYLGSPSGLAATPATTLSGTGSFGFDVTGSDFNSDGFGDVLIGAAGEASGAGGAYLYEGSSTGLNTTATTHLVAPAGAAHFGRALAVAGDIDHDGFIEPIVGTHGSGTAYVYRDMGGSLAATPAATMQVSGSTEFGATVGGGVDLDADGSFDVIVGGYNSDTASIYISNGNGTFATAVQINGGAGTGLAYPVVGGGDINGDGHGDFVVGSNAGTGAEVIYGVGSGTPTTTVLTGPAASIVGAWVALLDRRDPRGVALAFRTTGAPASRALFVIGELPGG